MQPRTISKVVLKSRLWRWTTPTYLASFKASCGNLQKRKRLFEQKSKAWKRFCLQLTECVQPIPLLQASFENDLVCCDDSKQGLLCTWVSWSSAVQRLLCKLRCLNLPQLWTWRLLQPLFLVLYTAAGGFCYANAPTCLFYMLYGRCSRSSCFWISFALAFESTCPPRGQRL